MDLELLKKAIKESGKNTRLLAKTVGIFRPILYLKMIGWVEFTLEEIVKLAKALNLSEQKVEQIFFAKKVS